MRTKKGKSKSASLSKIPSIDSDDPISSQIVEQIRKKGSKKAKKPSANDLFEMQDQQVLDIKRGDQHYMEHLRPMFLKRWDGSSNELELSSQQLDGMSPMLRVYWQHKSKNMNCIIFVQMGKVEFLAFENDAIKLHQIFKKPLKKFSKYLMVNFWSKQIQLAKVQLFERRIPVLMLNQIYDEAYKAQNGIFKRQITEVITPSIYLSMEPKQFRERNMLVIYQQEEKSAVACVDVQTNHIYVEQFQGQSGHLLYEIRRIINKYRPVEVLVQKKQKTVKKMCEQICNPYIIDAMPMRGKVEQMLRQMKAISNDPIFLRMDHLLVKQKQKAGDKPFSLQPIVKVLSMALRYMQNLSLQTKIFGEGIFQLINFHTAQLKPMFDAQVYQNLEVFHIKDQQNSFGQAGTLYHYLDHCITNSGKKMLKKWIDEPLRNADQIKLRQHAVTEIMQKGSIIMDYHKDFLQFHKLEKRIADIYHWALRPNENGKSIITKDLKFDKDYDEKKNPAVVRLNQICEVLKAIQGAENLLQKIGDSGIKSSYLKKCCKIIDAGNLYEYSIEEIKKIEGMPSVSSLTKKLRSYCVYNSETGVIEPREGMSELFDHEKHEVMKINDQLNKILQDWKMKLRAPKISYISVRARNEIQVPLTCQKQKKKYKQLIFSSQTSKMIRYVTAQTLELSDQLMIHQESMSKAYEPFYNHMVKEFCSQKYIWDLYVSAIARLDVLISLAQVSSKMSPRCVPTFVKDHIQITKGHHPGLLQVKQKDKVIGNSIKMDHDQKVMLLTGPNMGGKSTLLRQTCLLAIMAQIGCYVPAEKYNCIVYDQLFCRIGASDRMIQGKSTFYVQLEETKRIIDQATPNSLVIIDQLGRGTSTYDGMSLASAILKYIIEDIHCYTIFSTHYYPLTKKYSAMKQVQCAKIGYFFKNKSIRFNYQLEEGVAQKSFANQVAAMVGICQQTLKEAEERAHQMQITDKLKALDICEEEEQMLELKDFLKSA